MRCSHDFLAVFPALLTIVECLLCSHEILKENIFPNSFLRYFIFPEKLQHALLNENTEDTCAHSLIVVWENNKTFLLIPYRTSLFLPFKNDLSLYFNGITKTVWYFNIFDWWMASSLESLKLTMWKQPKQLAHLMPNVPLSSYYDQINPHCPTFTHVPLDTRATRVLPSPGI